MQTNFIIASRKRVPLPNGVSNRPHLLRGFDINDMQNKLENLEWIPKYEVWKDVHGYEGLYKISSYGNLKSLRKNRLLKKHPHKDGYKQHNLTINGKSNWFLLHRLLAIHFIPNPNPQEFIFVNHIDTIRDNNELSNLEWCTHSRNVQHGYDTGNHKLLLGGKNGRARKVINNHTKMIFDCAKDAHKEYGKFQYRSFTKLLSEAHRNYTGYSYITAQSEE